MIWDKKRDENFNCLNGPCKNKFELDDASQSFLFINWDSSLNKGVNITVVESKANYISTALLSFFIAYTYSV